MSAPRCICLFYGRGLSETRVHSVDCPVHGASEASAAEGRNPKTDESSVAGVSGSPDETRQLLNDLHELSASPLSYGQETHGELHADALAHIRRCEEAIRKILEGSEDVRQQGLGAEGPLSDKQIAEVAFALAHTGHDGIAGAPAGVKCPRCEAERALDRLAAAAVSGSPDETRAVRQYWRSLLADVASDGQGNPLNHAELCAWRFGGKCDCSAEKRAVMGDTVHVTPIGDLVEHDCTGGALCECVCGPDVEFVDGGGVLVSHHSLDGRELEEA